MSLICNRCGTDNPIELLGRNKYICSSCGSYLRIPAKERIKLISDRGSFNELFCDVKLNEKNIDEEYSIKLHESEERSGLSEAVIVGETRVLGEKIVLCVCDSYFMMGSMGYVMGERITRAIEYAGDNELPIFIFCCSGGARMQEGLNALMQMEKTSAALAEYSSNGHFCCTVLTDPTTGGVTASFAMLGDVIMAEKGATIGFTGKRVIKQTLGTELPDGFQSAEYQCEHGMVDGVVERNRIRKMIQFLAITNKNLKGYANFNNEVVGSFSVINHFRLKNKKSKTAWQMVQMNRKYDIFQPLDYVREIFDVFVELKGDRCFGDDSAIAGGLAMLDGQPVTVIATRRGKTAEEIVKNNYGMPSPEGYRKSLRLMRQADKFNRPIITFINTSGAYPGQEAEERGQGEAIARNLFEMSRLSVPILAIIVGEAGSGGALALAVANEVWMVDTATYSILSPEGYASIIWRDASRASDAAEKMNITAEGLKKQGIIDRVICSDEKSKMFENIRFKIREFLEEMSKKSREDIRLQRKRRFRAF